MKEFIAILRDGIAFYRETLGHPDKTKRTPLSTLIVLIFTATLATFMYNYGALLVEGLSKEPENVKDLREENIQLRVQLSRTDRELQSCTVDREDLLTAYQDLVNGDNEVDNDNLPDPNGRFYDRLEGLN